MVSLLISLTTTPMMSATILKPEGKRKHGVIYRASEGMFNWIHMPAMSTPQLGASPLPWYMAILLTFGVSICISSGTYQKGSFPSRIQAVSWGASRRTRITSFQSMQEKLTSGREDYQDRPGCGSM
jgi:multidrug efflux pump subunit AcrB